MSTSAEPRQMVFIDIETTGLDPTVHETIEVAWWVEGTPPSMIYDLILPHTLAGAEKAALDVNNYSHRELWDRSRWCLPEDIGIFRETIRDRTLVGANVGAFDTTFLTRITGKVWHHRVVEFESWVMGRLGRSHVVSLTESIEAATNYTGLDLPMPNHTAMGDVYAMQQCWLALNHPDSMRDFLSRPPADRSVP